MNNVFSKPIPDLYNKVKKAAELLTGKETSSETDFREYIDKFLEVFTAGENTVINDLLISLEDFRNRVGADFSGNGFYNRIDTDPDFEVSYQRAYTNVSELIRRLEEPIMKGISSEAYYLNPAEDPSK
jgi:hypothetical protein